MKLLYTCIPELEDRHTVTINTNTQADPITDACDWTQVNATTSRFTFKNLDSAKKYWCRVIAVGASDQVVVSDALSRVTQ